MMVTLSIDGREIQAEEGAMVLGVARAHNIDIPTLCDNEAVEPYGACRLCIVAVTTPTGRKRLVTSCLYPVEEGLKVETATDEIKGIRSVLLEMLLARCPESEVIKKLAAEYGVAQTRFRHERGNHNCILCSLCARVCHEVVGVSAISLVNRGVERELATPFRQDYSEACIGCGSCSYVCPTGAISVKESRGKRTINWPHNKMQFQLKKCDACGGYWVPEKQIEYIMKISGTTPEEYAVCPSCR